MNLVGTKLSVVKEEGSLSSGLLLEGDRSRLDAVGLVRLGGDGDVGDLAAVDGTSVDACLVS